MKARGRGRPVKVAKNSKSTPKSKILKQMLETRPLPMGRQDFEEWSDRIISGALVPHDSKFPNDKFVENQKCILAGMILHLGPTECHKEDSFFIHSLRKAACNEVAHTIGLELRNKAKARLAAEEEALKAQLEEKEQQDERAA